MGIARNVMVIPARKTIQADAKDEQQKLRVGAYVRVSTEDEEQASSYQAQIQY